jgi:DNA-binding XRE family transcriptional regulator
LKKYTKNGTLKEINPYMLKQARQARALSTRELAEKMGVTRENILSFESGQAKPPILQYIGFLQFPIGFFYQPTPPEENKGTMFCCGEGGCSVRINGKWYPEDDEEEEE